MYLRRPYFSVHRPGGHVPSFDGLSTIQNADEILVIQDGEIIERGHHQDLIGKKGTYNKLYELQAFN